MSSRRTPEQQRFWLELRRSNAATRHRSAKQYRRKPKNERDREYNFTR